MRENVLETLMEHGTGGKVDKLFEELLIANKLGRWVWTVARLRRAHAGVQLLELGHVARRFDVIRKDVCLIVFVIDQHLIVFAHLTKTGRI